MKSKITLLTLLCFFLTLVTKAQAPNSFNYQAAIRNTSGAAIANQLVALKITIREGTPTGTIIYQETHSKTTSAQGLVNALVGTGTVVSGTYPTTIQLGTGVKYFQVEVDAAGGSNFVDLGINAQPMAKVTQEAAKGQTESIPPHVFTGEYLLKHPLENIPSLQLFEPDTILFSH